MAMIARALEHDGRGGETHRRDARGAGRTALDQGPGSRADRPRRHGHRTFAERVARPGGLQGGRRVRVLLPVQSAIVVQPHHKALVVLLQMRQQLVVIAFAIHYMDRARLRSQAGPHGRHPFGPAAVLLLRIPEPGPPVRLRHARGIRLSDERGQSQDAQRGAQAVRRDRQGGVQPEPVAPWAKHRQAGARRFPGEHVFGGVMQHQHVPDRPTAVGGRLHMGAITASSETRRFRRNRYSASVSASLAQASGNPVSGCCSRAAMTRSRRALSRASPRSAPPISSCSETRAATTSCDLDRLTDTS